ncbi:MAG: hypothetical protein QHH74_01420 [Spirochaetota bacterium]|nr:hypothetical protein [Spirochaetota bacterium]
MDSVRSTLAKIGCIREGTRHFSLALSFDAVWTKESAKGKC